MRFTTWPALPTAFIIFTAALLSLIPAANAQTVPFSVLWDSPNAGDLYIAGQESKIMWDTDTGGNDLSDVTCQLWLHGPYGIVYQLTEQIPILDDQSGPITYPPQAVPSTEYFISMVTKDFGIIFYSGNFTIAYQ
ncbi:hypothetical protein BJV77DRAFT_537874 [Russula vinacea]|nr:hypothetical protein BJV77DRAFT_537874 [Russula vinacea]